MRRTEKENQNLRRIANVDKLTGLLKKEKFMDMLASDIYNALRNNYIVSAGMADVDFFKTLNDTYGHQKGDEVLAIVARIGREELRFGDNLGRYGGEEFCSRFPFSDNNGAYRAMERWRMSLASERIKGVDSPVTISGGVADIEDCPEVHLLRGRRGRDIIKSYVEGDEKATSRHLEKLNEWLYVPAWTVKSVVENADAFMKTSGLEGKFLDHLGDIDFNYGLAARILIQKADNAMYSAKRNGRNRVEIYPPSQTVVSGV